MSAALCPKCSRSQPRRREHCCPTAAEAELQVVTAERDGLADRVQALENEVEILEALRVDVIRQAESQGVWLS